MNLKRAYHICLHIQLTKLCFQFGISEHGQYHFNYNSLYTCSHDLSENGMTVEKAERATDAREGWRGTEVTDQLPDRQTDRSLPGVSMPGLSLSFW